MRALSQSKQMALQKLSKSSIDFSNQRIAYGDRWFIFSSLAFRPSDFSPL